MGMTILQKEMAQRSETIKNMGYLMAAGLVDIAPDNESVFQTGMAAMLEANEQDAKTQNETFERMPWLKRAVGGSK